MKINNILRISIGLISIFSLLEIGVRIFIHNERVDAIVKEIKGEAPIESEMRLSTIPYLTYFPTPNYKINGKVEHNSDGYRGPKTPLNKEKKELRLLFLGGSTTYGYGVSSFEETYPHLTSKFFKNKYKDFNVSYINGGIPYGTSAELLTHYLFKYKYYSPDIVIINTGGNDADAYIANNYQPDYNNWRKLPGYVPKPRNIVRLFTKSKLLSYIYIYYTMPDLYEGGNLFHNDEETRVSWFDNSEYDKFSYKNNAFYNNINELVNSCISNKSKIVLLTFRGDMSLEEEKTLEPYYLYHDTIMQKIADQNGLLYLDFPSKRIPSQNFIDECHLDFEGQKIKANYVVENIEDLIDDIIQTLKK